VALAKEKNVCHQEPQYQTLSSHNILAVPNLIVGARGMAGSVPSRGSTWWAGFFANVSKRK